MITIIVAHDKNGVIGNKGAIPWKIPAEMTHFKETTTGWAVVMGRKTWESIPQKYRPLPDRYNIVVSRNPESVAVDLHESDCVRVMSSVEDAVQLCQGQTFVIGGAEIYKEVLDKGLADRVLVSEIDGEFEGDTYFPMLGEEWGLWSIKAHEGFRVLEWIRTPLGNDS
jgi:dihydrofolate reductase